MRMKLIAIFILSMLFFLNGCNEKKPISQVEAQQIAATKLAEYAKRNNLSVDQFGAPETRYNKELGLWEIYYQSSTTPKHSVALMVGKNGGVEESFSLDDKPK